MALEDFKSESSQEDEDTKWVSEDGIDWTCCSCDISEVGRLEEPVDELDLIAHMRAEHNESFEDAKDRVLEVKKVEEGYGIGTSKMGDIEASEWDDAYK